MIRLNTDRLNILFIVASLIIAIVLPFELFLFSYAILGPMHYLTEINWLKTKNYFSSHISPIYILIGIVVVVSLIYFSRFIGFSFFGMESYAKLVSSVLILSSFLFILLVEFLEQKLGLLVCLGLSLIITLLLIKLSSTFYAISIVFLPTLIHVYLFTGFFMLYGYTKSKHKMALWSVIFLFLIPGIIYILPSGLYTGIEKSLAKNTYYASSFSQLNELLSQAFSQQNPVLNLKIQTFIAFAYTYHYLNWFGKTNVIGWVKSINFKNMTVILIFWLSAIAIYLYDYSLGFTVLFSMSLAHVLLEFPLNIKSIKSITLWLNPKRG